MNRIVYVNGNFFPEEQASISIFDRGFLMADSVYEVTAVVNGMLVDYDQHFFRLSRSLEALEIDFPIDRDKLHDIHLEIIRRNDLVEGIVYLQISRGVADRDFTYSDNMYGSVVLFSQDKRILNNIAAGRGINVITVTDGRWARRDIKTTQLLYSSLIKMQAKKAGADDAWFFSGDYITEGTSSNAFIVKDNRLVTRELSNDILHGITRASVLRIARDANIDIVERAFTVEEAKGAEEAFSTSASTFVLPVVTIDETVIGTGRPGQITTRLL